MMQPTEKQKHIKNLLTQAIVELCRNQITHQACLVIEGTVCVSSDYGDVQVVQITEVVKKIGVGTGRKSTSSSIPPSNPVLVKSQQEVPLPLATSSSGSVPPSPTQSQVQVANPQLQLLHIQVPASHASQQPFMIPSAAPTLTGPMPVATGGRRGSRTTQGISAPYVSPTGEQGLPSGTGNLQVRDLLVRSTQSSMVRFAPPLTTVSGAPVLMPPLLSPGQIRAQVDQVMMRPGDFRFAPPNMPRMQSPYGMMPLMRAPVRQNSLTSETDSVENPQDLRYASQSDSSKEPSPARGLDSLHNIPQFQSTGGSPYSLDRSRQNSIDRMSTDNENDGLVIDIKQEPLSDEDMDQSQPGTGGSEKEGSFDSYGRSVDYSSYGQGGGQFESVYEAGHRESITENGEVNQEQGLDLSQKSSRMNSAQGGSRTLHQTIASLKQKLQQKAPTTPESQSPTEPTASSVQSSPGGNQTLDANGNKQLNVGSNGTQGFNEDDGFGCTICGKMFEQKSLMERHYLTHDPDIVDADKSIDLNSIPYYLCEFCHKKFRFKSRYREHIRTHTKEKPYVCPICTKAFSYKGDLCKHMPVHSQAKPYVCEHCNAGFSFSSSFNKHMQKYHNVNRVKPRQGHDASKTYQYECHICKKRFKFQSLLERHLVIHENSGSEHIGIAHFQCQHCLKRFRFRSTFVEHLRSHTKERPFECKICVKAFGYKADLQKHVRAKHPEVEYMQEMSDSGAQSLYSQDPMASQHIMLSPHSAMMSQEAQAAQEAVYQSKNTVIAQQPVYPMPEPASPEQEVSQDAKEGEQIDEQGAGHSYDSPASDKVSNIEADSAMAAEVS